MLRVGVPPAVPPDNTLMPTCLVLRAASAATVLLLLSSPARAQLYDSVGIRAQGLGGAFIAVADDATATWWNPAGLATGAYFNGVIEYGLAQQPREVRDATGQPQAAWQSHARGIALAFPALGLSYYRLQISEIRPITPTAGSTANRQDTGTAPVRLRALVLNQFGATVGQSMGNHLVVGSTLKLVRGSLVDAPVAAADASLERADRLSGDSETHADLDVGALATFGGVRLGITVKNVRAPEFGADSDRQKLKRQARAGVAVIGQSRGAVDQLALAIDADLTRTETAVGDARHVAGGIEAWTLKRRLGVRAGVSANTIGERRLSPSGGASLAVRTGTYFEGQYTAGSDRSRRGWGFGLRLTF